MRHSYFIASVLLVLSLGGCAQKSFLQESEFVLKDLQTFPQSAEAYVDNIRLYTQLLPLQEAYDKKYFEPWNYIQPPFSVEAILWPYASYTHERSYGIDLQLIPAEWFAKMYHKGNYEHYGMLNKKAISLSYLNLRSFPTEKPLYRDPGRAGEGFPFDYMQNSGIHANEPLFVSHLSEEGDWAYVFTAYATGWVPLQKISFVSDKVAESWQNARQVEILDEFYPIKDLRGGFVFYGRVGMRLPLVSIEEEHYIALAITPGKNHSPVYTQVKIPFDVGHEGQLLLNSSNLKRTVDLMLRSNYGWGGLFQERDCSSMLRDLYAPFGIWLPRNSSEQAKAGRVISLEGLTLKQKRELIIKEGVPFETLIYKPGHILLYLGMHKGEIAVLHNVWGIKTLQNGVEGRKIIGKTVITSLHIGEEVEGYDPEKGLLSQIRSINIITQ
ncbi:MAG: SH3 domain-containing protein [Campylobacterales bacterium]|nr:SH3 domain-containing protein [Campylobacterales bacterium]